MKTVFEKKINILIILMLIVLSVFVMGINADGIFASDDTGTETEDEESTWITSGYWGDNEDVPWHVTADWELIIGEDGKEYTYTQEAPVNSLFSFPWQSAVIKTDQETYVEIKGYIRKVRFAGTVHVSGYCGTMFHQCSQLEEVDFSGLDASGITNMASMFNSCYNLKEIDLSGLDVSSVTTAAGMFIDCRMLQTVDLRCFSNAKLTSFKETFNGCTNLQNVNLSGIDTSGVTRMDKMFYNCSALESIDVSGFDTSSLTVKDDFRSSGSKDMFTNAGLTEIALGSSTFPSDVGLNKWIRRTKTLSGETIKGPEFDGLSAYDGSAPGWYAVGVTPGTGTGSEDEDPGTGTEQDPEGTQPGTEDGEDGQEDSTPEQHKIVIRRIKITSLSLKKTKYEYNGKRIRPAVVVKAGSRVLRKGKDYTVKYSNNKAIGKARIKVTGIGRYKGKLTRRFRIIPDRVKVRARSYKIVEGTQIIVSLSYKSKPTYYEFQLARDKKFRHVIARKKFTKKKLLSGKIYAYKHLKKGKRFYIRIRLIRAGLKGRYSKTAVIRGRG